MLRSFGVSLTPTSILTWADLLWVTFLFIIGAVTPVINWLILKKWPNSPVKYLHWPVFFSGTGYIPPATPYNYTSYCAVGLFFGWWIKRSGSTGGLNTTIPCLRAWILVWHGAR